MAHQFEFKEKNMLTINEQERAAYMAGDTDKAALLAQAALMDGLTEGSESALCHIDEARTGYPDEDCLASIIDEARTMARGRVTKAEVLRLVEMMEELQLELARSAEYGLDELKQAKEALK
jgi:hypothetical protein